MGKLSTESAEYFWKRAEENGGFVYPHMFDTKDGLFASAGLTQRELFAAMAMQGLLANPNIVGNPDREFDMDISEYSVYYADSLIEALNEPQSDKGQSES